MGINIYRIYKAEELETALLLNVEPPRWNTDNTEFIVEFISEPTDELPNINKEEAKLLMLGKSWVLPTDENGDAIQKENLST
jgi:hypothetical protein